MCCTINLGSNPIVAVCKSGSETYITFDLVEQNSRECLFAVLDSELQQIDQIIVDEVSSLYNYGGSFSNFTAAGFE